MQEGVAKAMGTTQAVVAQLESGERDHAFDQRTERFAKATRPACGFGLSR